MNAYAIPPFMSSFLTLCLGLYVLIYRRSPDKSRKLFFLLTACFSIWLASYGVGFLMSDPIRALFFYRFGYFGVSFIPVLSLHLHMELIGIRKLKLMKFLYLLAAVFIVLSWTPLFFKGVNSFFWGYYPQANYGYHFFVVFFIINIWAGPGLCFYEVAFNKKSNISDLQRKHLWILFVSFFVANFGTVDFLAKYGVEVYPFGYLNITFWAIIMAFAVMQYHLLDATRVAEMLQTTKLATISTITASVNHEIKNPLYIIQGLSQSFLANLKEGIYPNQQIALDKARDVMGKMEKQSRRAVEIMRHFSSFAKQQAQTNVHFEELNIEKSMENILPLLRHELQLQKVELVTNFQEDLPSIYIDLRYLEEILFNLIINACQAMHERGGKVYVSAYQEKESVCLCVRDNGPGLSEDQVEHIFDAFYTTRKEGTGLGMYITKQLVEKAGGQIQVDLSQKAGASFHLTFKRQNAGHYPVRTRN